MFHKIKNELQARYPAPVAEAHCDGPCGVYDPADARIGAEAVLSLTKKILALEPPKGSDQASLAAYHNTLARYITLKEEQAQRAKEQLLILWTDYFKEHHLKQFPDLHDTFWKAAKLCSACKVEINQEKCEQLLETCKKVHEMFWKSKDRDVPWYTAS